MRGMCGRVCRRARRAAAAVLFAVLAVLLAGCMAPRSQQRPQAPSPTAPPGSALQVLSTLAVKGRAPKTGYARERFGQAWTDDTDDVYGHNGCDTRNDILRRDLVEITLKPGTDCTVLTGTLHDPYTGKTISFVRGRTTSAQVQIEHVVALSNAWQTGAQYWSEAKRTDLANDPLELLAVDGPANQAKGAGDAATWLPPDKSYRCAYVARQVAVKARYGLWVTRAEHDAIERVLSGCPGRPAPSESGTPATGPSTGTTPSPRGQTTSVPGGVYYQNCAAVRAAGKAPLHREEPGYRPELDGDGDGVACE